VGFLDVGTCGPPYSSLYTDWLTDCITSWLWTSRTRRDWLTVADNAIVRIWCHITSHQNSAANLSPIDLVPFSVSDSKISQLFSRASHRRKWLYKYSATSIFFLFGKLLRFCWLQPHVTRQRFYLDLSHYRTLIGSHISPVEHNHWHDAPMTGRAEIAFGTYVRVCVYSPLCHIIWQLRKPISTSVAIASLSV